MKYLAILILLSSCVTEKKCYEKFPPEVRVDSVTTEVIVERDTVIYLPADSVVMVIEDDCPDLKDTILISKRSSVKVGRKNGILKATAICNEDSIKASLYDKYKNVRYTRVETRQEPIPWWKDLFAYVGMVLTGSLVLIIGYRKLRRYV